ncbi:lytic transglycosylase domain-containing protein [Ciceribacter sp. L1K23]|uniref:lytic transglycosylase domain-containing protein n=1 Tax=Ciceribacter sp. L1K23 TaxID=2820276 RepID=UPI002012F242|nr:lytic transglycosylase domain-containing protein [Ciceribacter sp. L1K23]
MTFSRPIALKLGTAALIVAGISGCSSSMEDAARQELKANPKVATPISSDQALIAALTPAPEDPATATPAPVIPGTNTPAPLPNFRVMALAASSVPPTPAEAEAVVKAQEQAALQAPAMPTTSTELVTTLAPAGGPDEADDVAATTTLATAATAVPSAKPAGGALAYAATPAVASFSVLENSYDVTPPGPPPVLDKPATTGPTVLNALIKKYAALYEVPESLVHRVVHRESRYNPAAYSKGNYGLMQIRYNTAKSMGYDGPASGLFDAEANIKYATKYLKGAWLVADKDADSAIRLYARGYYYDAKAKGMLHLVQ